MIENFSSTIGTITELEEQCNAFEMDNFVKLKKLEAVHDDGDNEATEGTFDDFDGDIAELGKADLHEGGNHSAFINGKKKNISITRK